MFLDEITLALGDWQYNAGLVGFVNILEFSGKTDIRKDKYEITFPASYLEDFSFNYFDYLIDYYMGQISYGRIIDFEVEAENFLQIKADELRKEQLDAFNKYIKDVLQYYMKSNSYKAAFECLEGTDEVLNLFSEVKTISKKKTEEICEKIEEIHETAHKILQIIQKMKDPKWRRYIGGKNVIYMLLKRNWDGVSVLNRTPRYKDIFKEFHEYFVAPVIEDLEREKTKDKYECFACHGKIKDLNTNLSFLTHTGFDTARKPSHVWGFQNDIAICPLCKLVYACVPAGFAYGFDKGIFVNSNVTMTALLSTNRMIKGGLNKQVSSNYKSVYRAVIEAILRMKRNNLKYSLADVQLVFYENARYRFNILHKNILKIIVDAKKEFSFIEKGYIVENGINTSIYEETLRRLLENQNMYSWIYKLLHLWVSKSDGVRFNLSQVEKILKINVFYLKGVGLLASIEDKKVENSEEKKEKHIVDILRGYGARVRILYKKNDSEKKLDGISHQMLNALKNSKVDDFMNLLLRCYMYIGEGVPKSFIDCLKDPQLLRTYGYAFVLGLNKVDKEEIKAQQTKEGKTE